MSSSSPSSRSASSSNTGARSIGSEFGPNEWLIEEMYERFLHDPSSVDSAWHEFFADYKADQSTGDQQTGGQQTGGQRDAGTAASAEPKTAAPRAESNGQVSSTSGTSAAATSSQQASQQQPQRSGTSNRQAEQDKPSPQQAAKAAPVKSAPAQEDGGEQSTTLRGAAAAIAKNMEQSLTVPTATSVRAVPAKLLYDNRIVINNTHIQRLHTH